MENIVQSSSKHVSKVRSRKRRMAIDMTPMVDLAFLLLTFFILTTTFTKPYLIEIAMPDKDEANPQPISEKRVLNLVLGANDIIYWYVGLPDHKFKQTQFSANGIRKVLMEERNKIKNMIVLIKPSDKSKYKNMIDIIDEMSIASIDRYTIVDISDEDIEQIKKFPS